MTRQASAPFSDTGRRRAPRLDVDGPLHLQDITAGVAMHIQDVSRGGFRTLSPVAVDPGTRHTFDIVLHGDRVTLVAQVVHCRGTSHDHSPFTIGWECEATPSTDRGITRLLNYLTNWASFAPDIEVPIILIEGDDEGRPARVH